LDTDTSEFEAVKEQYLIRNYQDKPVSKEKLKKIR